MNCVQRAAARGGRVRFELWRSLGLLGVLLSGGSPGGGLSQTLHLLSGPADGLPGRLLKLLETGRLAVVLPSENS